MKNLVSSTLVAVCLAAAVEAAPSDVVTKADLDAIVQRLNKLEAENKAQAKRIGQLEMENRKLRAGLPAKGIEAEAGPAVEEGTTAKGNIYTTKQGYQFYLADKVAGIFQPLTPAGLAFRPYGFFVLEGVHNTHKACSDYYTDYLYPRKNGRHNGDHQTSLSVNDTKIGFDLVTPEEVSGWKFDGKFEFDFAGDDANHPKWRLRHLYFNADHAESGWSITFGQTWHLWKMIAPNEIDGAWLENSGYPYRRSPQLRVTKVLDDVAGGRLELRAGIVKSGLGMGGDRDNDRNEDTTASAWPLLEGAAIYTHKASWFDARENDARNKWMIGLGGQYGRDKSRRFDEDGTLGKSDEYDSKMIMLAGELPVFARVFNKGGKGSDNDDYDSLRVIGHVFAGENLGGVQAGVGQRVGFREYGRRGREVGTVGALIDIRYDWNRKWAFALGYGVDDPIDREAHYARGPSGSEGITCNGRIYADVFYWILPNMRLAFEYARLKTRYYEEGTADDDRFQFTLGYNF